MIRPILIKQTPCPLGLNLVFNSVIDEENLYQKKVTYSTVDAYCTVKTTI